MRQIPLYALTFLVALALLCSFIAPFHGALETTIASNQDVSVAAEDFELPAEMQGEATQELEQPAPAQEPQADVNTAPPRQVDPDDAPAPTQLGPLQRVEPRKPLSEIGHGRAILGARPAI